MNIKKWVKALAVVIPLISINVSASAQVETINATGRYMVGDGPDENYLVAKKRAREDAKRRAVEMAGVYVKSYSRVVNLQLVEDEVTSISAQILKILKEDVRYNSSPDGSFMTITCNIVAEIDTDNILFEGKQQADLALNTTTVQAPAENVNKIPDSNTSLQSALNTENNKETVATVAADNTVVDKIVNDTNQNATKTDVAPVVTENSVPVNNAAENKENIPVKLTVTIVAEKKQETPDKVSEVKAINSSVSVKAQTLPEEPLMEWDFILKPQNYTGAKNIGAIKSKSVKFVPNPENWECYGKINIPYYWYGNKFMGYNEGVLWISPESIVQRGDKVLYQAALYHCPRQTYIIYGCVLDLKKKIQIMKPDQEYAPSTGRVLDESDAKTRVLSFEDNGDWKSLLHYKFVEELMNKKNELDTFSREFEKKIQAINVNNWERLNSSASNVISNESATVPLKRISFVDKQKDFTGDSNTKMLSAASVGLVPDSARWECVGKIEIPNYFPSGDFNKYVSGLLWIDKNSIEQRATRLNYNAVIYNNQKKTYSTAQCNIDYKKQQQIINFEQEYAASDGRLLGDSSMRTVVLSFDDHHVEKTFLHYDFMRRYYQP